MNPMPVPLHEPLEDGDESGDVQLLDMPDTVVDILVSKCGDSSLKSLLNLRQVSKTTKAWVDTYPVLRTRILMRKAQVRMETHLKIVKEFIITSPPMDVRSLVLDTSRLERNEESEESEIMLNIFFEYWTPRLEELEIQTEKLGGKLMINNNNEKIRYVIQKLMESPKLKKLIFLRKFDWNMVDTFPETFKHIKELVIDGRNYNTSYDEHPEPILSQEKIMTEFYKKLENNQNLRYLAVSITCRESLRAIKKFLQAARNNERLIISLTTNTSGYLNINPMLEEWVDLIRTTVAAKFETSFHLRFPKNDTVKTLLTTAQQFLTDEEYVKFTTAQIQSLEICEEQISSSVLNLKLLAGLKSLEIQFWDSEILQHLKLPDNLKNFGCGMGIPNIECLPLSLTCLVLFHVHCGFEQFEKMVNLLGTHCVNLKELSINYTCECDETNVLASSSSGNLDEGDYATSKIRFRKLESMSIKVSIDKIHQFGDILHEIIINRLKLDQLPLMHLVLIAFCGSLSDMHEPILTRLCDGEIGTTLMFMDISSCGSSKSPVKEMERLSSKLKSNINARIESEGKGPWLYKYPRKNPFSWI